MVAPYLISDRNENEAVKDRSTVCSMACTHSGTKKKSALAFFGPNDPSLQSESVQLDSTHTHIYIQYLTEVSTPLTFL